MAKTTEKKGFFKHWIVRNLMAAAIICIVLLVGAIVFLNIATQHNKELAVPDLRGMTVQEAQAAAEAAGIRVEVIDSVYSQRNRGKIKSHTPSAGTMVKNGRRVLLTVNAVNAKKVTVPNLVGYSLRQAIPELDMRGLELGRLIYRTDIATNNVLQQLYRGRSVAAGAQVEAESVIDLVVGLNAEDCETIIPDVVGKDEKSAKKTLHDSYLNVKRSVFDKEVQTWEDSLNAVVYKQNPAPSEFTVGMGTDVTIYLKKAEVQE
jgi:beta-lactam-binding protein with PASTA domain